MSEDLNQLPGEPDSSGQPQAEAGSSQEVRPKEAQRPQPMSESIIPEQPVASQEAAQPQYPPSPEYYAQMSAVNPYSTPPPDAPIPGVPMFPPPVSGVPMFPPPMAYGYGFPPVPQAQPLPLSQAIRELPRQYKKILFKPGVRSFAEEQGKADWGIIWLQLLFVVSLQILANIPLFLAYNQFLANDMNIAGASSNAAMFTSPLFLVLEIVLLVIFTPLAFFIGVGVQYLTARAFKGIGSFKQQAYNQLLFQLPIGIASAFISLILSTFIGRMMASTLSASLSGSTSTPPTLSAPYLLLLLLFDLLSLGIGVYTVILNVFSIMAVHRMSGGKAVASVLLPIGIAIALVILCTCGLSLAAIIASSSAH